MAKLSSTELLDIIKSDNVTAFSALITQKKTIIKSSLGRFPILSICYLFNSKKIIRKYEKELLLINDYIVLDEPIDIIIYFKSCAGRSLRLFVNSSIISPIEMLAVLHKDKKVSRLYKNFAKDEIVAKNLNTIYQSIYCQDLKFKKHRLKITSQKLTSYQKRVLNRIQILCLSFVMLFVALGGGFVGVLGDGVFSDAKIYNVKQLISAGGSSRNYILKNDLVLSEDVFLEEFSGHLDGNNRTITIENSNNKLLINNLTGSIKNLNIVYKVDELIVTSEQSLFVGVNDGEISNVNISYSGNVNHTKTTSNSGLICGLTVTNNGTIQNCELSLKLDINSTGEGEAYFCGIAGENNGTIIHSQISESSKIQTINCDISGIVGINNKNAKVDNCKNYADLVQSCDIDGWSPLLSGIAGINYGNINNTFNYGDIALVSNNQKTEDVILAIVGGVCGTNYLDINNSINKGNISISNEIALVYCGGVCGRSLSDNISASTIQNCGNSSLISVNSNQDKAYSFIGGVCGFLQGNMIENFSVTEFNQIPAAGKYYQGGCIGGCYVATMNIGTQTMITNYYLNLSENYYLYNDNISFGIGGFLNLYNYIFFNESIELTQLNSCADMDLLIQSGVYWDE